MPDNPQPPDSRFALPDHRVLALEGRDAVAFAQAQFMNDVATLAPGTWQWSGWLTPKGRVVALFALLRLDPETLWLLLPDADPAELAARLQRFVFRSKVRIAPRPDCVASGAFAAPEQAHGNTFHSATAGSLGLELDFGGDAGPRTLWIDCGDAIGDAPAATGRWAAFDLEHGLPRLAPTQAEQWTPQQLSLERLRAFSVKKGCYPGQEIVARTHFLGQAKRGLALFEAQAPVAAGSEVREGDQVLGTIVSSAAALALAVVPVGRAAHAPLVAEGAALAERPLRDGLAR